MPNEGYACIQGILGMLKGRKNCHALTTLEVLNFTGWLPYSTREEFAQHRAEHPELEPFPLYDFEASDQTHDKEAEEGGGSPQRCTIYMVDLGFTW